VVADGRQQPADDLAPDAACEQPAMRCGGRAVRRAPRVEHNQASYYPDAACLNMPYGATVAGDLLVWPIPPTRDCWHGATTA
jgi:hypothetical protein